MSDNPYAPPQAALEDREPATTAAEATRRAHIGHERQLKSVGLLYFLYAAALLPLAATQLSYGSIGVSWTRVATMAAIAVVAAVMGYGFRTLRPWVRTPGVILSALGLAAVPVGTLINGYVLYLILNERGRVVLAPGYRAVVEATPHVRYRRTVGDWIALGLVALVLLSLAVTIVIGTSSR